MYRVAVLGTGYVGLTVGIGLANFGLNVLCLDIAEKKIDQLKRSILPTYEPGMEEILAENIKRGRIDFSVDIESGIKWAEVIFIAVGTPQGNDGNADLSALFDVAHTIGSNLNGYKIIVTKSTVPIGTNEKIKELISKANLEHYDFDVVSNPEFLREGKAMYDFQHPDRVVIGTDNPRPIETMRKIYRPLYLNEVPFIFTDFKTAELTKYISNCFLAMKVAFINEISRLCDVVGADVKVAARAMGKDGRIGSKFLHPSPGFGGSCFPKDTQALAAIAEKAGMPLNIVNATIKSNHLQKLHMVNKIKRRLGSLNGVTLGVLGLAFKAETDDMRDSAAIVIIDELIRGGALIKAYDPQAIKNAKKIWSKGVTFGLDEYDTAAGADALVLLTEWNQFRNLDLSRLRSLMRGTTFFDFRNIYNRKEVEYSGLIYEGIGV